MRFSFCIPFFNDEALLTNMLESLEVFVGTNAEVLVSLDAPVSERLEARFANQYGFRWLVGPSLGIAANWNHCIEQATGDFIVLFHADDTVRATYLETILGLQQKYPDSAAWFCSADVIDEQGSPAKTLIDLAKSVLTPRAATYCLKGERGLAKLLLGCFIYCPTVCYRASVIKNYQFDERRKMVLDLDLYARLLMAGESIAGSNSVGYHYRRHRRGQSALLTQDISRFEEEVDLYNSLAEASVTQGWPRSARQAKLKVFVRLHILFELSKSLLFLDGQRAMQLWKLVFL